MKISEKLEFLFLLSRADAVVSRKLSGQGLSLVDLAVLYAISQAPDGKIRRTDLAEQVGLTASAVTRLLLPLEKTGVVKREATEHDARVSFTVLTKAGKELLVDSLKWANFKADDLLPEAEAKKLDIARSLMRHIA